MVMMFMCDDHSADRTRLHADAFEALAERGRVEARVYKDACSAHPHARAAAQAPRT